MTNENLTFFDLNDQTKGQNRIDDDDDDEESLTDEQIIEHLRDLSDLPASLIITNISRTLFENENIKQSFEAMFKVFDTNATFQYFRNFRRCRINFLTPNAATLAKLSCHKTKFHGCPINCFFAQEELKCSILKIIQPIDPLSSDADGNGGDPFHLRLPKLEKQFLISPPASPPAGWEQSHEHEPIIAPPPSPFDLFSRLASLAVENKDEPCVIYDTETVNPKIIVYGCQENDGENNDELLSSTESFGQVRYKLPRTPRPEYDDDS
uniref:Calcipressin-like protein n=1 Tax=Romanomermis culicivorax TaxID=13658 RepID=A0A915JMR6_ROMCU